MAPSLATWITLPLAGALIGYVTNTIAVKMIFRPIRPVRILGIRIQGLMGRRQAELAESIGRVVGAHLVQHEDIVRSFEKIDFEKVLEDVLDKGLTAKVDELKSLPLIGGFLTDDRVADIRKSIVDGIMKHKGTILAQLEEAVEEGLDVQTLVEEKVASFDIEKLESLVLEVARKELRSIEVLGAVLGLFVGVAQVFLLWWLG